VAIVYADDKMVRGTEIRGLYDEAGWTLFRSRKDEEIEESVRNSTVYVTAREGAKLIGFIAAISDRAYHAHVTEFLVRDRHRDRVGAELVRRCLEELGGGGVVTIFAEPDNAAFYEGFGFGATAGGMLRRRV